MLLRAHDEVSWSREEGEGSRGVRVRSLFGRDEGADRVALRLLEIRPGGRTDYHAQAWENQVFVLEGFGTVKGPEHQGPVEMGDALLIPSGEPYQFEAGTQGLRLVVARPLQATVQQEAATS